MEASICSFLRDMTSRFSRATWSFAPKRIYFVTPGRALVPYWSEWKTNKMRFEEWSTVEPALAGIVFWEERLNFETRLLPATARNPSIRRSSSGSGIGSLPWAGPPLSVALPLTAHRFFPAKRPPLRFKKFVNFLGAPHHYALGISSFFVREFG